MSVNLSINSDNSTVTFTLTSKTIVVNDIIFSAAHYLYDLTEHEENGSSFEKSTLQYKLAIVEAHLMRVLIDLAQSYVVNAASKAARDAAILESSTYFILEG
jgi:hypothetical protein